MFIIVILLLGLIVVFVNFTFESYNKIIMLEYTHANDMNEQFSRLLSFYNFIRCTGKTEFLKSKFMFNLRRSTNAMFTRMIVQRWITLRLDLILVVFVTVAVALSIALRNSIEKGLLVFSL